MTERFASASFNDFENAQELYRSSSGAVYRATFKYDKKEYVLKERRVPELGKAKDIMNELKLMLQLDHDNVVRCEGWFRDIDRKSIFMVLEWCAGGDLHTLIGRRRARMQYMEESHIWYIFYQLCSGLMHLHENGIIHRDLKPLNIMCSAQGRVFKIGDLGVSRQVSEQTLLLKSFYGTPLYLSPELADNKPYNEKTDIWSMGVILYEMCALQPPFKGNTLLAVAKQVSKGEYAPIPAQYSKQMHRCVAWMLNLDYNKRPNVVQVLEYIESTGCLPEGYRGQDMDLNREISMPAGSSNTGKIKYDATDKKLPSQQQQKKNARNSHEAAAAVMSRVHDHDDDHHHDDSGGETSDTAAGAEEDSLGDDVGFQRDTDASADASADAGAGQEGVDEHADTKPWYDAQRLPAGGKYVYGGYNESHNKSNNRSNSNNNNNRNSAGNSNNKDDTGYKRNGSRNRGNDESKQSVRAKSQQGRDVGLGVDGWGPDSEEEFEQFQRQDSRRQRRRETNSAGHGGREDNRREREERAGGGDANFAPLQQQQHQQKEVEIQRQSVKDLRREKEQRYHNRLKQQKLQAQKEAQQREAALHLPDTITLDLQRLTVLLRRECKHLRKLLQMRDFVALKANGEKEVGDKSDATADDDTEYDTADEHAAGKRGREEGGAALGQNVRQRIKHSQHKIAAIETAIRNGGQISGHAAFRYNLLQTEGKDVGDVHVGQMQKQHQEQQSREHQQQLPSKSSQQQPHAESTHKQHHKQHHHKQQQQQQLPVTRQPHRPGEGDALGLDINADRVARSRHHFDSYYYPPAVRAEDHHEDGAAAVMVGEPAPSRAARASDAVSGAASGARAAASPTSPSRRSAKERVGASATGGFFPNSGSRKNDIPVRKQVALPLQPPPPSTAAAAGNHHNHNNGRGGGGGDNEEDDADGGGESVASDYSRRRKKDRRSEGVPGEAAGGVHGQSGSADAAATSVGATKNARAYLYQPPVQHRKDLFQAARAPTSAGAQRQAHSQEHYQQQHRNPMKQQFQESNVVDAGDASGAPKVNLRYNSDAGDSNKNSNNNNIEYRIFEEHDDRRRRQQHHRHSSNRRPHTAGATGGRRKASAAAAAADSDDDRNGHCRDGDVDVIADSNEARKEQLLARWERERRDKNLGGNGGGGGGMLGLPSMQHSSQKRRHHRGEKHHYQPQPASSSDAARDRAPENRSRNAAPAAATGTDSAVGDFRDDSVKVIADKHRRPQHRRQKSDITHLDYDLPVHQQQRRPNTVSAAAAGRGRGGGGGGARHIGTGLAPQPTAAVAAVRFAEQSSPQAMVPPNPGTGGGVGKDKDEENEAEAVAHRGRHPQYWDIQHQQQQHRPQQPQQHQQQQQQQYLPLRGAGRHAGVAGNNLLVPPSSPQQRAKQQQHQRLHGYGRIVEDSAYKIISGDF